MFGLDFSKYSELRPFQEAVLLDSLRLAQPFGQVVHSSPKRSNLASKRRSSNNKFDKIASRYDMMGEF